MSKLYKQNLDLVELITQQTINNINFNSNEWSFDDADTLIKCGEMIHTFKS